LKAEAFGGLALCELAVDTRDGGGPNAFDPSHGRCGDALVVLLEDALPKWFGTSPPRQKPGQWLDEVPIALVAEEAPAMDVQEARHPEGVEMTGPAPIHALAAQSYACAARA